MSNTSSNPFTPPRAEVDDIVDGDLQVEPNPWSPRGRIGRLRYLAYLSIGYLVFIPIGGIAGLIGGIAGSPKLAMGIIILAVIPYLILSIFWIIQRTHDMGWSAWAALLTVIPFVAFIWLFKPGTRGSNRFGPPPTPNPLAIKIFGLALPVIGLIGIVAAVTLPAYQKYTLKAKAAQQQLQQR